MVGIFFCHLVECCIDVAVAATLTELWRTGGEVLCLRQNLGSLDTECRCHTVGSEFSGTRQCACESAADVISCTEHALDELFHHWLSVFHHEQSSAFLGEHLYARLWQRILRHLFYIIQCAALFGQLCESLFHVVVAYATSHDTGLLFLLVAVAIFAAVEA